MSMTKLSAVRIAIEQLERERKLVSHSLCSPLKGMEKRYKELEEALAQLRDIAQGLQSEPVRSALAEWQKRLMEDEENEKEQAMKF